MRNDYVYLALAALVGCAPPADRRAAAPLHPAPRAHVAAPAYVSLTAARVDAVDTREGAGPSAPGPLPAPTPVSARTEATLVARVTLDAYADMPVTVPLTLPPGATLRAGRARFTLPAVRPSTVVEERYVIAYDAPPAGPVLLRARAAGEAFGFNAEARWDFGRSDPPPRLMASGAPLTLGRHRFGPSMRVPR